jgi:hypothetical protein
MKEAVMNHFGFGPNPRRRFVSGAVIATAVAASAVIVPAGTGNAATQVLRYGKCTGHGTVSLQLQSSDPGLLEAGFELDGMHPGTVWSVVLTHDGTAYYRGYARTSVSGTFSIDRVVRNLPGPDRFAGTARNHTTGEVCTVTGTL